MGRMRLAALIAIWLAGYIVLLSVGPYHARAAAGVSSAASLEGYSTSVAFNLAAMWTLAGVLVSAWASKPAEVSPGSAATGGAVWQARDTVIEASALFVLAIFFYFPPALANYGPYIEDANMLTVLHRMHGGQVPYRDFIFLYGPLMIYPLHWWMESFGFSMTAYYWYLAILVGVQFVIVAIIAGRFVRGRLVRLATIALLSSFLIETLLGVNWNGTRRLAPLLPLIAVSLNPAGRLVALGCGVALGCMIAYSHDYGAGGLVAVCSVYVFQAAAERSWRPIRNAVGLGIAASVTWMGASMVLMRGAFVDYLRTVMLLVQRYSVGEAGFTFSWTVNSLAVFALLAIAVVIVGSGWRQVRRASPVSSGDRFLVGAVVYALVLLKSGLNRSDFWHLDPVVLGLVMAFVLPWPHTILQVNAVRRAAVAFIVVLAVTYLIGSAPTLSSYANGWARGMRDLAAGDPPAPHETFATAAPTLLWESNREPDQHLVALARYLADHGNEGPVVFYGDTFAMGPIVGVYKTDRLMDDLLFSDDMGHELRRYIEDRPKALIVVREPTFNRLTGRFPPDYFPDYAHYMESVTKRVGAWAASNHYRSLPIERRAIEQRLERTVAPYVRERFVERARFGAYVVLGRRPAAQP